jgi:cysteine synthase A
MTYPNLMATVGRTPLVELRRRAKNLRGRVFAKLEMRNPCGSVKDRVGVALIEDADARGLLKAGMTIVGPTGGNTGVGLAFVSAIRGYGLILTMPETMSAERVALLKQLGAKVVLTPLPHTAVSLGGGQRGECVECHSTRRIRFFVVGN